MALRIRYQTDSRLQQLQMFISIYSALHSVWVTDHCMRALAVFIDYGINADSKKLVMSMLGIRVGSYRNLLTKLKNADLLVHNGDRNGYAVKPELMEFRPGADILLLITINNPSIGHEKL